MCSQNSVRCIPRDSKAFLTLKQTIGRPRKKEQRIRHCLRRFSKFVSGKAVCIKLRFGVRAAGLCLQPLKSLSARDRGAEERITGSFHNFAYTIPDSSRKVHRRLPQNQQTRHSKNRHPAFQPLLSYVSDAVPRPAGIHPTGTFFFTGTNRCPFSRGARPPDLYARLSRRTQGS